MYFQTYADMSFQISFEAQRIGVFRALAQVDLLGQESRVLDINATVVQKTIELLSMDGNPLTDIQLNSENCAWFLFLASY